MGTKTSDFLYEAVLSSMKMQLRWFINTEGTWDIDESKSCLELRFALASLKRC